MIILGCLIDHTILFSVVLWSMIKSYSCESAFSPEYGDEPALGQSSLIWEDSARACSTFSRTVASVPSAVIRSSLPVPGSAKLFHLCVLAFLARRRAPIRILACACCFHINSQWA